MDNLMCRLSIFGSFDRFQPTSANIIEVTNAFLNKGYEFLPSIISGRQFIMNAALAPAMMEKQGIQYVTADKNLSVRVLADRIDVEANCIQIEDMVSTAEENISKLLKLMELTFTILKDIKGTRIAYFVDAFIPEKKENEFETFYTRNNLGFAPKSNEPCVEWMHRFNQRINVNINGTTEQANCIILLERSKQLGLSNTGKNEDELSMGLHLTADINTLFENQKERFEYKSVEEFSAQVKLIFNDIIKSVNEKIEMD